MSPKFLTCTKGWCERKIAFWLRVSEIDALARYPPWTMILEFLLRLMLFL